MLPPDQVLTIPSHGLAHGPTPSAPPNKTSPFIPASLHYIITIAVFLLVSWLLASRRISTAPDDWTNLMYFDGLRWIDSRSTWWEYLIEEPLWATWSRTIGYALGAETGMRLTIFLSSFGLLWGANRLSKGSWLFILLIFTLSDSLATQLYYNQIRQGAALTVFLVGISLSRRAAPILAAVAVAIHSSFIFGFAAIFLAKATRGVSLKTTVSLGLVLAAGFAMVLLFIDTSLVSGFLGRRAGVYAFESSLNPNFSVLAIAFFAAVMYSTRGLADDVQGGTVWSLTWYYFVMAVVVSFFHDAGSRLFYTLPILYAVLIARRFPSQLQPRLLLVAVVCGLTLRSYLRTPEQSVFDVWDLVLRGRP